MNAKMDLMTFLGNIIIVFKILIAAGIVFRCILVLQKCREEGCSWKQTFNQLKKYIIIGVITMTIMEITTAIGKYF